jgi:cytochrome c-type biogenesis protein CcmH
MVRRFTFIFLLLLLSAQPLFSATLSEYQFDDPQRGEEFRQVIEQMRCLVCQNESLAGSNAELAVDLRNEIYDMMKAGQDKDQIVEFMVARYGDFVLYSPPVKPSTYPIWFGPILLFMLGAFVLFRILRRKSQASEAELSAEEQQRLDKLLKQKSDTKDADQ